MKPYKGYLIDVFSKTVTMPSGFGLAVPGPSMLVWASRAIEATTGAITVFPDGSDENTAKRWIDETTDPTGKIKERAYLADLIRSIYKQIGQTEEDIEYQTASLASLKGQLERLKSEYKDAGGTDE